MKTISYTFTTWDDGALAAGFDGAASPSRGVLIRQPEARVRRAAEEKVIDLNSWRAANLEQLRAEPEEEQAEPLWEEEALPEVEPPAPRQRRNHHRARFVAELASTLAVAGAAAALMLRVLLF